MKPRVRVSLTDDEIATWFGDAYVDDDRIEAKTGKRCLLRTYDCNCIAVKYAGEATWHAEYDENCGIPHTP